MRIFFILTHIIPTVIVKLYLRLSKIHNVQFNVIKNTSKIKHGLKKKNKKKKKKKSTKKKKSQGTLRSARTHSNHLV